MEKSVDGEEVVFACFTEIVIVEFGGKRVGSHVTV